VGPNTVERGKGGRGNKNPSNLEEFSIGRLSEARMINQYAPELGDQVLAKQITFEQARLSSPPAQGSGRG
jgi:hypothetical protein